MRHLLLPTSYQPSVSAAREGRLPARGQVVLSAVGDGQPAGGADGILTVSDSESSQLFSARLTEAAAALDGGASGAVAPLSPPPAARARRAAGGRPLFLLPELRVVSFLSSTTSIWHL